MKPIIKTIMRKLVVSNLIKIFGIEYFFSLLSECIPNEEAFLVPSFKEAQKHPADRFSYQKQIINFKIKPEENVLDIGSGGFPFPYATHLSDLYIGETTHRADPLLKDGRPFLVCDIEKLPYSDKTFDYVYCSHLLEHVDNPGNACEEIMRIGKRGYIETPTRMSDIIFNFTRLKNHHKWHITMSRNTLIFTEWNDKDRRDTHCNDFFKSYHSKYENSFKSLFTKNIDLFVNMLEWQDKFFYYVFSKEGLLIQTNRKY